MPEKIGSGSPDAAEVREMLVEQANAVIEEYPSFALIPEDYRRVAVEAAAQVLAIPEDKLMGTALDLHNIALFARNEGDYFCRGILNRYDRLHCRLVRSGISAEEAEKVAVVYLRALVSQGLARLQMSKMMGGDIYVAYAEKVEGFANAGEMSGLLVQGCLGQDHREIREIMERDFEE